MRRYTGDPYWITARYAGACARCHQPIRAGERAFYYPKGKVLYCQASACGEQCAAEFQSAAQDEETDMAGYGS
jgi:hypothetical protein